MKFPALAVLCLIAAVGCASPSEGNDPSSAAAITDTDTHIATLPKGTYVALGQVAGTEQTLVRNQLYSFRVTSKSCTVRVVDETFAQTNRSNGIAPVEASLPASINSGKCTIDGTTIKADVVKKTQGAAATHTQLTFAYSKLEHDQFAIVQGNVKTIFGKQASLPSGVDLTSDIQALVLDNLNDMCGDSWCEGDADLRFTALSCTYGTGACVLSVKVKRNRTTTDASCALKDVTKFGDIVETAANGFQDLTEPFVAKIDTCTANL
jgi:hypothetical protein